MNEIKCLYALSSMCRGTVAQWWHTRRSYSQPVNPILRSFRRVSITSGPAFQPPPPLHKNQIRLLPRKMPSDLHSWQQPMCARWGFFCFVFFPLRVNCDDFTATASHQEDPVQTLHENLQELHVWEDNGQGVHLHLNCGNIHCTIHENCSKSWIYSLLGNIWLFS